MVVRVIGPAVFLNVLSAAMLFSARQALALEMLSNSVSVVKFLTRVASAGAGVEFLLNPVFGKLSDAFGRRAIIPLGSLSSVLCRGLIFMFPRSLWTYTLDQCVCTCFITSFFTTWRAAVADLTVGDPRAYAVSCAKAGMFAGLGVIAGPILSTRIMGRWGARHCFLAAVAVSSACATHLLFNFEETLPPSKRERLNWLQAQPFSFVQLMSTSRPLAALMCVSGLQTLSEGRNTTDVTSIYMREDLGWGWPSVNRFISALGVSLVVSGGIVRKSLAVLGMRGHTSVSNFCNAAQWLLWGAPWVLGMNANTAMYFGLILTIPGARKRDAVESLIMNGGSDAGLGKGMISSSMMNFRAIVNIIGPYFFGKVYAIGARRQWPGLAFVAASATVVAAEICFRTVSLRDLRMSRKASST